MYWPHLAAWSIVISVIRCVVVDLNTQHLEFHIKPANNLSYETYLGSNRLVVERIHKEQSISRFNQSEDPIVNLQRIIKQLKLFPGICHFSIDNYIGLNIKLSGYTPTTSSRVSYQT